jgi:hypothetical protein
MSQVGGQNLKVLRMFIPGNNLPRFFGKAICLRLLQPLINIQRFAMTVKCQAEGQIVEVWKRLSLRVVPTEGGTYREVITREPVLDTLHSVALLELTIKCLAERSRSHRQSLRLRSGRPLACQAKVQNVEVWKRLSLRVVPPSVGTTRSGHQGASSRYASLRCATRTDNKMSG